MGTRGACGGDWPRLGGARRVGDTVTDWKGLGGAGETGFGRTRDTVGCWGETVTHRRVGTEGLVRAWGVIGSQGRDRSSAGGGWEATAAVWATHRWGAQAARQGRRAGRGSRGDPRRPRSGLCSRSRLERTEPGGARSGEEGREGRGGAGRGAPPQPGSRPLAPPGGQWEAPSRGG